MAQTDAHEGSRFPVDNHNAVNQNDPLISFEPQQFACPRCGKGYFLANNTTRETPPDYLTSVSDGGFYGWPYCYWNRVVDDRVPQDHAKMASALRPDYALGGHTASLGLCWLPEGTLPGFRSGMAIGQHGSWNRSRLSGYKLAFVAFEKGKPMGMPREILTDFLSPDEKYSYGRPGGVALAADGAVLMADDVGDVIWRVTGT